MQASATRVPPDQVDSVWKVIETTFRLNADGTMSVVDVRRFEAPTEGGSPAFAEASGCGADFRSP